MDEYISREFMLKNLEADKMNNAEHCEPVTVQIMERFIRYVKEFPAAAVQTVKHGKWICNEELYYNGMTKCSCCNEEYYTEDIQNLQGDLRTVNYCPNCGARMDLKDGEE